MQALGADPPTIVDAPYLKTHGFALTPTEFQSESASLPINRGGKGWLRRYAPSGWGMGTISGSLEAAIHRGFLTLIGSISRLGNREWLTRIDEMLRAEDRLVQLETAASLGISVPRTLITSQSDEAATQLGSPFVVKPMSLGVYWSSQGPRGVHTTALDRTTARNTDFGGIPFMAQELIEADQHYRVVTVLSHAWIATLSAFGRPLDWRTQESAHREWSPAEDEACASQAVRLAKELGVGYSSQDWLVRGPERIFIDLNPGGQWLFLPEEVAAPVTAAIGRFLSS